MWDTKEANAFVREAINSENELAQISTLYRDLNVLQAKAGMSIRLVKGGEHIWMHSMRRLLGKYSQIIIAEHNDAVVGFSAGVIRILPPYYGSVVIGFWDSMYILKEYRGRGLGDQMTRLLLEWWANKGAVLVEGERLCVNENAKGNYERLGFHEEVIKYRKIL